MDSSHLLMPATVWQILNMMRKQWPETEVRMDQYLQPIATAIYPSMMIVITTKFLYNVLI